jgi:hypothetical protein
VFFPENDVQQFAGTLSDMAFPEVERKVRQYGADIDSIWEILASHSEDLAQIKETLVDHGTKLDNHSVKLDNHSAKLDEVLMLLRRLAGDSTPPT